MHYFKYILVLFSLIFCTYITKAQNSNTERHKELLDNLYIMPDAKENMTFEEALQKNEFKLFKPSLIQDNIQTYWLKLNFQMPENSSTSVFIFNFTRAEEVIWYDPVTRTELSKAGFMLAWKDRPFKVGVSATMPINFVSPKRTLYFKLQNKHSFSKEKIHYIFQQLNYYPIGDFEQEERSANQYSYLYLGILLGFAIYHLFLFFTVRHRPYLYLGLFGLTLMFFRLNLSGILLELLPSWTPVFLPELLYLNIIPSIFFYILFAWNYLKIKAFLPKYKMLLWNYGYILTIYAFTIFFQVWWFTYILAFTLSFSSLALTLYFAILIRKKYVQAKYFIYPNALVLLQVFLMGLYYADWLPYHWYSDSVTTGGGLTILLFFSISLTGYRNVQTLRREAKQRNIIKLQENVNRNLEKKARARMQEIESKNEELTTLTHYIQNVNIELEKQVERKTTKLKESYEKLIETEKRTQYIISAIDCGLFFIDSKANINYFSDQNYTMLGYEPHEFLPRQENWARVTYQEDREIISDAFRQMFLENKENYEISYRMKIKSGNYKWIMERGKVMERNANQQPVKIIGTRIDIDKIKTIEENLKKTSLEYKSIKNALEESTLVIMMDKNSKITYVNKLFTQVCQFDFDELVGANWEDFIKDYQSDIFCKYLMKTISSGHIWKGDIQGKNKSGDSFWTATVINPILNQNKEVDSYLIIGQEISTRKNISLERKKLMEQMTIYTQDMEQFTSIVSHHLNQPVSQLRGLTALLSDFKDTDNTQHVLSRIQDSAQKFYETCNDLNDILETRNTDTFKREVVNVASVLERMLELYQKRLEEVDGKIISDLGEVKKISVIRVHLETALNNLLSNAIKFRNPDKKLLIHIKLEKNNKHVSFHIKDNGLGIDLKTQKEKIFLFYQRFHLDIPGKGLGLHMSNNLIKSMGGSILVKSEELKGSTFTIKLPI
ncbi:MAG: PAS domain S-box protein [Bacteroidetes bacterium]|nr:MAG: PAS domain S-box protein [Bacteroidota bacterium]TAG89321.1 MAG: PAS domain S-box protein [Bacteroidota bacterium]